MSFASVYPLYVAKAEKKGRTRSDVDEVIRWLTGYSEMGLATLLDRKINTGNIRPFADVVAKVMTDNKLKTLADAAKFEKPIIAELTYRRSFLEEPSLGQPPAPPTSKPAQTARAGRFDLFGWLKDLLRL